MCRMDDFPSSEESPLSPPNLLSLDAHDSADLGQSNALGNNMLSTSAPAVKRRKVSPGEDNINATALNPALAIGGSQSKKTTGSTSQHANVSGKVTLGGVKTITTDLQVQADNGDVQAMHRLGSLYSKGLFGEEKDQAKSYYWFKRAADNNHVPSLAIAGSRLLNGIGAIACIPDAMILLGRAAQSGSDLGVFMLGDFYRNGRGGVQIDNEQACYWLRKLVENQCDVKHAHPSIYGIAASWLHEIESQAH